MFSSKDECTPKDREILGFLIRSDSDSTGSNSNSVVLNMDGEGVVTGLGLLRLSQLPSKWIDDVWENNFLDTAGQHTRHVGCDGRFFVDQNTRTLVLRSRLLTVSDTWPVDEVPPHDVIAGLSQLAEGLLQWKPRSGEMLKRVKFKFRLRSAIPHLACVE